MKYVADIPDNCVESALVIYPRSTDYSELSMYVLIFLCCCLSHFS